MPKRSPAKIDYRDCEKRGRRCLLISQQCRWKFGKISLSVFRYDTSSDSAIGKQLKLPVRSILNQSQLNHVWDQYGRCLYACTIDDKLVVKRDSVVFVEVRSRYTFTTSWFSAVKSLAYENTTLVRSFEFGQYKMQIADSRLQTADSVQNADWVQIADCRLSTKCRLRPKRYI